MPEVLPDFSGIRHQVSKRCGNPQHCQPAPHPYHPRSAKRRKDFMLKVIVVGLGPIGLSAAKTVAADKSLKLVGIVDVDPAKIGKTLGELTDGAKGGPKVVPTI